MKTIYLAGGCFWGLQKYFDQFQGILETEVGYANGKTKNPTYQEVCTQATGFVETLKIVYHPVQICLSEILDLYFDVIDPFSMNQQGPDKGTNYRTGIYYVDHEDLHIVEHTYQLWQSKYDRPFVVEVQPLENYYSAEQMHQKYLENNPQGYCHIPFVKMTKEKYVSMSQEERMSRKDFFLCNSQELRKIRNENYHLLHALNQMDNAHKEERYQVCQHIFGSIGEDVNVKSQFYCDYGKHIHLGNRVFINSLCVFSDVGQIIIHDDVCIGPQVGIYTVNHPIDGELRKTGLEYGMDVEIGQGCWIGGHVTINPGVRLGSNVVVASGSVVTHSFPDNVMIAGVPAKIVKELD